MCEGLIRVAIDLCRRHQHIMILELKTTQIAKKYNDETGKSRIIPKSSASALYQWNHYTFIQKLQHFGEIYKTKIHIVTEPWTSKKCSGCHHLKMDLKGSRLYECDNCGLKMHRDLNSAFNIYVKNLESCLQSQVEINQQSNCLLIVLIHMPSGWQISFKE